MINIAIDGPSAAGKSTISDILASKLNYVHLDTGAMYRCAALKAINNNVDLTDAESLSVLLNNTSIRMTPDNRVFLDDVDVTKDIRQDHISMAASDVSKIKVVREILVKQQQEMAKQKGFILDGRDIGTVVLPDAEVKIYLTASSLARAKRRLLQNQEKGIKTGTLEEIQAEIEKRDYQDMHRDNSPLRKADDAIEIDSSDLSIDEVIDKIMDIVKPLIEKENNE